MDAYDSTKPWGDLLYDEQQSKMAAFLQMPRAEWLACVNTYLASLRGNGVALISALSWFTEMETKRAEAAAVPPPSEVDEETRTWRVWTDLTDEPWKYGSDIGEWTELDAELRRGPKRWRVDAYWWGKVREQELADAATRIQALWRGYATRQTLAPQFTCSRCIRHGVCTTPGTPDTWVCYDCTVELWEEARESLDPMEECDDCGETIALYGARIGDFWLCPACIHEWSECSRCSKAVGRNMRCENHCIECGDDLDGLGQTNGFCSGDCQVAYTKS